ncbi:MAG: O-antigen ligase family protein [Candidatus Omnitrophica bacterium]|nr:O-antigen ligase family protein [Candidatus Omnitrophota bacterium]
MKWRTVQNFITDKQNIIIGLDRLMEAFLYTIIFTLPFSNTAVEIAFVCALFTWVAKRFLWYKPGASLIESVKLENTKLNLPIAAFVLFGFLSTITSVSVCLSLKGFFFKLFELVMVFFIVVEFFNSKKRLNRILIVMLLSMVFITIDGMFQFITGRDFIRHYKLMYGQRMQASFCNPNDFGGWLVTMIPLALSLLWFSRKNYLPNLPKGRYWAREVLKLFFYLLSGSLLCCLFLTHSLGAYVATILSVVFLGIFKSRKLLIAAIMILWIMAVPFIAPFVVKENSVRNVASEDSSIVNRLQSWHETMNIVKDFPLLGAGLNTFSTVRPWYRIYKRTYECYYPHNSYLHMAAESGLLGLGAFIWIIGCLFKMSVVNLRKIPDKFHKSFLVGLMAGLFGFLVHSFVDTNFYSLQLGVLMWFVMGIIVAIQRTALSEK